MPPHAYRSQGLQRIRSVVIKPARLLAIFTISLAVSAVTVLQEDFLGRNGRVGLGPEVGATAPPFELPVLGGRSEVRFQPRKDKPTVLIFGSFT